MKTVFIGSVKISAAALETLFEIGISIDLVCSLDEAASAPVCDYAPIHDIAKQNGAEYITFKKVDETAGRIKAISPDVLFVIGISQMIPQEIIESARYTIGFHPTPLPRYRGRAPIPWMILLREPNPKISLFLLDEGMDSGDILHQEPYEIAPDDHATEVYSAVCGALRRAIRKGIPPLYDGTAVFTPQNHDEATFLLIRRPEDGRIDWRLDGREIYDLIRAAAPPYPGAFAYYKDKKVTVTRASICENRKVTGLPGQIYKVDNGKVFIVTNGGYFLILEEFEPAMDFRVGTKLQ